MQLVIVDCDNSTHPNVSVLRYTVSPPRRIVFISVNNTQTLIDFFVDFAFG